MCSECPASVWSLARRLRAYIEAHDNVIAGGLHIVIEDENVESHHITWCVETQELDDESRRFAAELLEMPVPSRHMAIQLAWESSHIWEALAEELG